MRTISLVLAIIFCFPAYSQKIEWDPSEQVQFRPLIEGCGAYLSPARRVNGKLKVNKSVGIPLSTGKLKNFKERMLQAIEEKGHDKLKGSYVFVTGVHMGKEEKVMNNYKRILADIGFAKDDIKVKVLSIPRKQLKETVVKTTQKIWDKLSYFRLSLLRDYEAPIAGEISTALVANAFIEVGTIDHVLHHLPSPDAQLTLLSHFVYLSVLAAFGTTARNWILRSKGKIAFKRIENGLKSFLTKLEKSKELPEKIKNNIAKAKEKIKLELGVEGLIKQFLLGAPFILNYQIFGNFTAIKTFINNNNFPTIMNNFWAEQVPNFFTTQTLSIALQTYFYNKIIVQGIGGWVQAQKGPANIRAAKAINYMLSFPLLFADAIFLAMAANTGKVLFEVGPMAFNSGHLMLTSLIGTGFLYTSKFMQRKVYDKMIPVYLNLEKRMRKFRAYIYKNTHINISDLAGSTKRKIKYNL
jgi:hypothetical protein